jgi:hypothetical protein
VLEFDVVDFPKMLLKKFVKKLPEPLLLRATRASMASNCGRNDFRFMTFLPWPAPP